MANVPGNYLSHPLSSNSDWSNLCFLAVLAELSIIALHHRGRFNASRVDLRQDDERLHTTGTSIGNFNDHYPNYAGDYACAGCALVQELADNEMESATEISRECASRFAIGAMYFVPSK